MNEKKDGVSDITYWALVGGRGGDAQKGIRE